jgi:hypothetical protein
MKKIKAKTRCQACGKAVKKMHLYPVPGIRINGRRGQACKGCLQEGLNQNG